MSERIHERFDRVAEGYAAYRPSCPPELIRKIASLCRNHEQVWEPGCGSGQVTPFLASAFDSVLATDPAPAAIAQAPAIKGVRFEVGDASRCSLGDGKADLIAVAQASHWFNMSVFVEEARRVAAPDAVVALWCYDRPRVSTEVDAVIDHLYFDVLKGCWDAGREHIDTRYTDLSFPFKALDVEVPDYQASWTVDGMLGYLRTWSAVDVVAERGDGDAIAVIDSDLKRAWGSETRTVCWPVGIRAGRTW